MTGRNQLKQWFLTGLKPTEGQFAELINSFFNLNDDVITIAMVQGLSALLSSNGFNMTTVISNAPIFADEAAALAAGLLPYTLYKTATGELRYKLPNVTPPPPSGGFTYTFPITLI